jgi:hypothetical protein
MDTTKQAHTNHHVRILFFVLICLISIHFCSVAFAATLTQANFTASMAAGGIHELGDDISLSTPLAITGVTTSLNLLGHRITLSSAGTMNVNGSGSLTISDTAGSGAIILSSVSGAYIVNVTAGRFTLLSGLIQGVSGNYLSCVNVGNGSSFTMTGGAIKGNLINASDANGGAVTVQAGGLMEMSGGVISGNAARRGGGIIVIGNLNLNGNAVISDNTAVLSGTSGGLGGAIYVTSGTVNMSGGTITRNYTQGDGGGVAINAGRLIMSDGTISENTTAAGRNGGGIWTGQAVNSVLTMTGGTVTANSAGYGAGIEINSSTAASISGVNINNNTASISGGGIDINGFANATILNTTIDNNKASYGGAVSLRCLLISSGTVYNPSATIGTGTRITNNYASSTDYGGGGVFALGGTADATGATITGNSTAGTGGGVLAYGDAYLGIIPFNTSFTMTSGILYGNSASIAANDLAGNIAQYTTINLMAATSMGYPKNQVDNWYWDSASSRYAGSSNPVAYTPNDPSLYPLFITTGSITSNGSITFNDAPQTGDNTRIMYFIWLALITLGGLLFIITKKALK